MGNNQSSPVEKAKIDKLHAETKTAEKVGTAAEEKAHRDREAADKFRSEKDILLGITGITALVVVVHAIDFAWNGYRPVIGYRVKRHLKRGIGIETITSNLIKNTQDPLLPTTKPTILLGPSGCGKSTFMTKIAIEAKNNKIPVAYLNFRQLHNEGRSTTDPRTDMMRIGTQIMTQIGYPTHEPYFSKITNIKAEAGVPYPDIVQRRAHLRLQDALEVLFSASVRLKKQTGSVPILLFDEVHDLIKNTRLRDKGGSDIFEMICSNLVNHGVTHKNIRSVVAGSSGSIVAELEKTHLITSRVKKYYLDDLDEEYVRNFLMEREFFDNQKYSKEDCDKVIKVCGTRLRLLEDLLWESKKVNIDLFIEEITTEHVEAYTRFLDRLGTLKDKQAMFNIFESLHKNEEVSVTLVPIAVLESEHSSLLYIGSDNKVIFQNDVCRYVWPSVKEIYSTSLQSRTSTSSASSSSDNHNKSILASVKQKILEYLLK